MAGISDILSKNYEAFFPFHILKGKYDWDGDISWTMTSSGHFFAKWVRLGWVRLGLIWVRLGYCLIIM